MKINTYWYAMYLASWQVNPSFPRNSLGPNFTQHFDENLKRLPIKKPIFCILHLSLCNIIDVLLATEILFVLFLSHSILTSFFHNFVFWHMWFVLVFFQGDYNSGVYWNYLLCIDIQGKRLSFVFWEKLNFHKKWSNPFEINWPLAST